MRIVQNRTKIMCDWLEDCVKLFDVYIFYVSFLIYYIPISSNK